MHCLVSRFFGVYVLDVSWIRLFSLRDISRLLVWFDEKKEAQVIWVLNHVILSRMLGEGTSKGAL